MVTMYATPWTTTDLPSIHRISARGDSGRYLTVAFGSDTPPEAAMHTEFSGMDYDDACRGMPGYTPPHCASYDCDPLACHKYDVFCLFDPTTGACRQHSCSDHTGNSEACLRVEGCTYDACEGQCFVANATRPCTSFLTDNCTRQNCDFWDYFSPPVCVNKGAMPPCKLFSPADCSSVGCRWSTFDNICHSNSTPPCETFTDNATCPAGCHYQNGTCGFCTGGLPNATVKPNATTSQQSSSTTTTTTTTTTLFANTTAAADSAVYAGREAVACAFAIALFLVAVFVAVSHARR